MIRPLTLSAAAVGLVLGWWSLWFLCDDAFIAFRYVSNSQLGHGYVWNAPPFHPVEGYSSFLWVFLLDWIWTVTGIEPPDAANPLALLFGFVQVAAIVGLVDHLKLTVLRRHREVILFGVLLATLSNRTFLAWTSSGLETSMFDAFVLCWLWAGLKRNVPLLALFAALLELSRPDGLLFCATTVPIALLLGRGRALWPLALSVAHVGWRIATYGDWLPNTYYAKVAEPWPSMGLAYLSSFALEYGFWLLLPLLPWLAWRVWNERPDPLWPPWLASTLLVGTLLFHVAYYTLRIGGDHFEYRVYAWVVPLVWVGAVWAVDTLQIRPRRALAYLTTVWLVGLPLPWTLWAQTHDILVRFERGMPTYEVAPHFPAPLKPMATAFDEIQEHIIGHFVGMRTQTHLIYLRYQQSRFPTREEGSKLDGDLWVMRHTSVGWPAWALPHVAIIDEYGLNDAIVARYPIPRRKKFRMMAHERQPPPGYSACFSPNVSFDKQGRLHAMDPARVLTPDGVKQCEEAGWAQVEAAKNGAPPPVGTGTVGPKKKHKAKMKGKGKGKRKAKAPGWPKVKRKVKAKKKRSTPAP